MKHKLLLLLLVVVATPATAQPADSLQLQHDATYFLQKSKRQNTAGWVLTATGIAGLGSTFLVNASDALYGGVFVPIITGGQESYESKSYTGFYLLSLAMIGTGIAFFVSGQENRKRARNAGISFKVETIPLQQKGAISHQSYPSVGIRVSL